MHQSIKDLKVKGSSSVVKVGTKIKGIRLVESADNHNIDCSRSILYYLEYEIIL